MDALPALTEGGAIYFDGQTSRRRVVVLRLAETLEIFDDGAFAASWPYDDIRRADGARGALRLSSRSATSLARLDVADEALKAEITARCKKLDQAGAANSGNLSAIVGWSLAAAVSIALIAIYGVPLAATSLTPLIPPALEAQLGDAVAKQVDIVFSGRTCDNAEGRAALTKLAEVLAEAGGFRRAIEVDARKSAIPNAFAIPGDRIYILSALLDRTDNIDEFSGVLAHEMGHVAHRDGLRSMIASGGSAFLFGLLLGDITGSGAILLGGRMLLNATHSREAESAADAFAGAVLVKLGRSPAALGEFLLRMTGEQSKGPIALLASHPVSQDRLAALKRLEQPTSGAPLLSEAEWQALKAICP